jgi:hypothetical protein
VSDITKCSGKGCLVKKKCYRFKAKAGVYQAYFLETPGEDETCEYFWETK